MGRIKITLLSFIVTLIVGGLIAPIPTIHAGDGEVKETIPGSTLIEKEIISWENITI